jgi:mannitol 2-dehydrogenase
VTHLDARHLPEIGARVPVPAYDRGAVSTGIVHLGVGGFHRSHQAMYVDTLLADGGSREWGITGIGLLPQDRAMLAVMQDQDCLYTLVVKHADGSAQARVIGSLVDYLFAPDDADAVLTLLCDPGTRIVSLTITEGGYHLNQASGAFDDSDPGIHGDLTGQGPPTTAFGFLTEALARRRRAGHEPFTVLSCDNLEGNGEVARAMLTAFGTRRDPELGAWIRDRVAFPSSMVDRITPATTDADRERLTRDHAVDDAWPVVCEPFAQWVVEDDFPTGRPPLERVGVQLVEDVAPYELMKLRLLNAGHQAVGYLGYLAGHRYVHEACRDPLLATFLLGYMEHEATPTLAPVPGVDLDAYRHGLLTRFANPEIADPLARLCAESSDRIPKWLVPVIRHQLAAHGEVRRSALVVAAWARYAEGVDEDGAPIEVVDRRRDQVMARAARQRSEPLAFLEDPDLFADLAHQPGFVEHYLAALESLHVRGARATLEAWT